jgi:hypothetical protein
MLNARLILVNKREFSHAHEEIALRASRLVATWTYFHDED